MRQLERLAVIVMATRIELVAGTIISIRLLEIN